MAQHILPGDGPPIFTIPPRWLSNPYAGPYACYGCGLEPTLMNPGQWVLCFWCNELRTLLTGRQPSFADLHYDPGLIGLA